MNSLSAPSIDRIDPNQGMNADMSRKASAKAVVWMFLRLRLELGSAGARVDTAELISPRYMPQPPCTLTEGQNKGTN